MAYARKFIDIFKETIDEYHKKNSVETVIKNPFEKGSFESLLYHKAWIDAVQWHLEDIIRNPDIDPAEALIIKRRIDASNQERTDMVEFVDSYFLDKFKSADISPQARVNTESPAWAIDRLSILELKIYHMRVETERDDVDKAHKESCLSKLNVLCMQEEDLSKSIDELISDIEKGLKKMKVYKQMKMYNDPLLNPVLYDQRK